MNIRNIVGISAVAILLTAGVASAQTANGVTFTTTPNTSTVSPGTGVNLGTVTFSGGSTGGSIASLPVTITAGGGATTSNLSNCQAFDANGSSITTGNNIVGSVSSTGANTFNFNNALGVSPNGTSAVSIRCNVAANTPAGATFAISAGTPVLNPSFGINVDVAPSVPRGAQDVTLASFFLSGVGSGAAVNVSSLPVSITAGSGASMSDLTSCSLQNATNLGTPLSGFVNPAGGTANFNLAIPLTTFAGLSNKLALVCDVSASAPIGGTYTIGITPASVNATNAGTGATVTPGALSGMVNGAPAATSGTVVVSGATIGEPVPDDVGGGSGIPGIPNTGAGGALTIAVLLSGLVALLGTLYLRTRTA